MNATLLSLTLTTVMGCLTCLIMFASTQRQKGLGGHARVIFSSKIETSSELCERILQHPSTHNHHVEPAELTFVPPDDLYFVVSAPSYSEFCGGCMVLHRLCDRLNTIYDYVRATPICYLVPLNTAQPPAVNPGYKTPLLPAWMNASSGIAIYPEIVTGNPLKADRVVNWILYFPGVNGGPRASGYNPANLIACFSPGFCADFNSTAYHMVPLRVVDYQFTHFLNVAAPANRSGMLTFRHKTFFQTPMLGKIPTVGKFPVPENPLKDGGKRSRIEQYAQVERFYSMDPATFRTVEAAMAGTLSVVVPVPGVGKAEWLKSTGGESQFGVAYGDEDVPHAQSTLPCVMPYMREKASRERGTLDSFVREAASFFAKRL